MKNELVFPQSRTQLNALHESVGTETYGGLTKREYYAGLAMQGIISKRDGELNGSDWVAMKALDYADALISELEKPIK